MFQFIFRRTNNNKLQQCFLQIYRRTKNDYSTNLTPEQEKIISERLPKPKPISCCGNGCNDCALVHYFEELEEYERQKRDLVAKLFDKIPSIIVRFHSFVEFNVKVWFSFSFTDSIIALKDTEEEPLLQQYNATSFESQLSKK
jgi:hypothetical protein